jgi:hypothetical protein
MPPPLLLPPLHWLPAVLVVPVPYGLVLDYVTLRDHAAWT